MSITFETARLNGLPGVAPTMIDFGTPPGAGSWGITIEQEGTLSVVMAQAAPDGKSVTGNIDAETATTLIEDAIATLRTRGAKAHRPEIDRLRVALSDVALYGVEGEVMRSIVSSPTVCGRRTVTQLLLDDRTLECVSVMDGERELHITREERGGYSVEWGDDWSPAPAQVGINALLEIDDLDDEVLDALEAAALELGRQRQDLAALASHGILADLTERAAAEVMDSARPSASTRRLPLAWLTLDPRCQPRDGLDEETVVRYASIIREGQALPAISVVENPTGPERWVTDGYHRVEAHRRAGAVTIEAQITPGSLRDAIWASTAANATHGLTRSRADLHRAIETLIGDEEWAALSDRELARHISCDGKTIAAARRRRAAAEVPQPAPAAERQEHPLDRHYQRAEALLGERREPAQTSLVTAAPAEVPQPAPAAPQPIIEEAPLRCAHTVDIEEISSDEWYTPRDVVEMARVILGGIGLDPASCSVAQEVVKADVYWTAQDDALTRDWGAAEARTVWLNPPYSRALIAPFAKKFIEELTAESFEEALILVNASVCATWWQDLARQAQLIAYPPKRLAFWRTSGEASTGNAYDSSMMFFGAPEDAPHVRATLRSCGWIVTSGAGA